MNSYSSSLKDFHMWPLTACTEEIPWSVVGEGHLQGVELLLLQWEQKEHWKAEGRTDLLTIKYPIRFGQENLNTP